MTNNEQATNIKGMRTKIKAQADHIRKLEKIIADSRTAPTVAAQGLPSRKPVPGDMVGCAAAQEWNACHDAFTAWLSKAAQGLPLSCEENTRTRRGFDFAQGWNKCLSLCTRVVTGMAARNAELEAEVGRLKRSNLSQRKRRQEWYDRAKEQEDLALDAEQVRDTLRTRNAELVELLHGVIPKLNAVEDFDLISKIYALSAYEGREGE